MSRVGLFSFGLAAALTVACAGCTHVQLRKNTVRQADTLSDIYEQQVLDNLAMFVYDYNSLPHFAFPTQGLTQRTDSGGMNSTASWDVHGFSGASVTPSVSRANQESWTLTPLADPRVLELMRCAYQRAVQSCYPGAAESGGCPACQKRFNEYYTGDPNGRIPPPGTANDNGIVTSECLRPGCCWFHVACEKCLPKYSKCRHVGHYCGVYVCVPPGRGQDELSKLTLVILDYAFNKAATPEPSHPHPTEQVVMYQRADGTPATPATAEKVITCTRPVLEAKATENAPGLAAPGGDTLPRRDPRPNPSSLPYGLELRQQLQGSGAP